MIPSFDPADEMLSRGVRLQISPSSLLNTAVRLESRSLLVPHFQRRVCIVRHSRRRLCKGRLHQERRTRRCDVLGIIVRLSKSVLVETQLNADCGQW